MQVALRVERDMQPEALFQRPRRSPDETALHHRFAAGEGHAAGELEEPRQRFHLAEDVPDRHPAAVAQLPGVGVVAIEAAKLTAGHEEHETHARPVDRGAGFQRMQKPLRGGHERVGPGLELGLILEGHGASLRERGAPGSAPRRFWFTSPRGRCG